MVRFLGIYPSDKSDKKYYAEFETDAGRTKRTYFGAAGMKDYTKHSPAERDKRRQAYLTRHRATENWNDPTSAGALARWILWEKPTVSAGVRAYKNHFGFV